MKLSLSGRDQKTIAVGALLAILVLWVYFTSIVGPLVRAGGNLIREVQQAREKVKTLEHSTANEETLRQQHQEVTQTVSSLRRLLPPEEELPAVIELISTLANQSQVKIQTIFPQRSLGGLDSVSAAAGGAPAPVYYKEIPIQIDALAGYHQLGSFLSLVESGEKPMRVASLRISANPKESKRHSVKLLLRSYFATTSSEPVATR